MKKFVLYFTAIVLAFDAIYLSIVGTVLYGALVIPAVGLFAYARSIKIEKDLVASEGMDIGQGIEISNPEKPSKLHVFLDKAAVLLGFLFIGGPGSGKTIAVIGLLNYITRNLKYGWLYNEGKGDLDIYQTVVASGCKPDKFFSTELPYTDTTNAASGSAIDVIETLTKTCIKTDNEFYKNEQMEALSIVIHLLKSTDIPINMRDIYVTLKLDEASEHVLTLAEEQGVKRDIIETARQYFDQDADKRREYCKGLLTNLGKFVTGDIAERLNDYNPTLDLAEACAKNLKVYMHMPLTEVAKDVAIMFTEQLGVIARQRQLYEKNRVPWPAIFDDWGAFFYDGIGPITSRCRSAGIPANFTFQSKGQTDEVKLGNIFTTEIFDNIGGLIGLKINGIFTARVVSEQFGNYESTEMAANSRLSGENINVVDKPRVRPDEFKNLSSGECFIDTSVSAGAGIKQSRRYKARFPMPAFECAPESIDWPVIERDQTTPKVTGLNLWEKFMNRDRVKDLEKAMDAQMQQEQEKRKAAEVDDVSTEVDYL